MVKEINEVFNTLCNEIYFSFNFRCMLLEYKNKHPDKYMIIKTFFEECRQSREDAGKELKQLTTKEGKRNAEKKI